MLLIHLLAGMYAYSQDLVQPFSMSKKTATYIKSQHLNQLPIIGIKDYLVSPLSGFLNKKIYYPESDRLGSFIIWNSQRKKISDREILKQVDKIMKKNKYTDILLVLTRSEKVESSNLQVTFLAQFYGGIISDEKYQLYRIQKEAQT